MTLEREGRGPCRSKLDGQLRCMQAAARTLSLAVCPWQEQRFGGQELMAHAKACLLVSALRQIWHAVPRQSDILFRPASGCLPSSAQRWAPACMMSTQN